MNLINSQIAMTNEPKAIDPKWYLAIHLNPLPIDALPPESAV